ncbi:unnamed protein product [Prorocentrum cordatum]|uniref:Uncharacterized protein n=1 Tax=Prorocentrum cordatum TaxID=2364126 RepID=A0ABN9T8T5_9DINO|nr:unnamed protein product [Polarella glacialis]
MRFAEDAARVRKAQRFTGTRLCQWTCQLDRGLQVCFRELARALGQHGPRWTTAFDATALSGQQRGQVLRREGLGTTVFAEGMSHERALRGGELGVDATEQTVLAALRDAEPVAHPCGRALNAVGSLSPLLSGNW